MTSVHIRETAINLHTYNRSLELCARMNYETEVLDFIDQLNKDDILYDLGSAEGRFSLYAALKGIRVLAFEPENKNYDVFMENIKLNPGVDKKLTVYNLAVGETNQASTIKVGQPWAGGHQKIVAAGPGRDDLDFSFHEEQAITIVCFDDFLENNEAPFPTALKIDIDGSEISFVKGAKKTLADSRVKKIIFELCIVDKSYIEIINLLNSVGYQEQSRFSIPNEPNLYNIIFTK